MDTTQELESRISNAMARIKLQAGAATAMAEKYERLQMQRAKDIAELDELVDQLKPFVGED